MCVDSFSSFLNTKSTGDVISVIKCSIDCLSNESRIFMLVVTCNTNDHKLLPRSLYGPRQVNLVLIAYASSEGSGEPAHPRSLARTSAARLYKQ